MCVSRGTVGALRMAVVSLDKRFGGQSNLAVGLASVHDLVHHADREHLSLPTPALVNPVT